MNAEKLAYSIDDAVKAASVGRSLIYSEISAGNLRVRKIGRRTVILSEDLQNWLRSKVPTQGA